MSALLQRLLKMSSHSRPDVAWHGGTVRPSSGAPIAGSPDLARVLALPYRDPVNLDDARDLVTDVTKRLRRTRTTPCSCAKLGRPCIVELLPAQAWALDEAPRAGGLLAPIGVGHGKSGLDILISMVMGGKNSVLLIPPNLVSQIELDYAAWAEHFEVPQFITANRSFTRPGYPIVQVVPYSRFSRAGATDLLTALNPDLIIADEAHKLRHAQTATTSRVLRHFAGRPETRLCAWSGTITSRSIKDYAHLMALALREGSPLPLDPAVVDEWAMAIDPSEDPRNPGSLLQMCAPGEHLLKGFSRRLLGTCGVVSTRSSSVDSSLILTERPIKRVPDTIAEMLDDVRDGWVRPDGEDLLDIMDVARCARQLACGFFYRWKFPRGEPAELIEEWFARRKRWRSELRRKLEARAPHLDSEQLCTKAAIRFESGYEGSEPTWQSDHWNAWSEIANQVQPETETVWVDDFLVNDAIAWGKKHKGVIWYEHVAVGERIAKLSGYPRFGGGKEAEAALRAVKGGPIVVGVKARGTGFDGLQDHFSEQLVVCPPGDGAAWEQLLGRLHRQRQTADEVVTYVFRHTEEMRESLDKALAAARYIQDSLRNDQKLLIADVGW